MSNYWLSIIVLLPLLSILLLLFVPASQQKVFKWGTILTTFIQLVVCIYLYSTFDTQQGGITSYQSLQWVEQFSWIQLNLGSLGKLHIQYLLGVDGLSMSLILLASLVLFIGALASWTIKEKTKGYFILYLLLSSSVVGCFVALDFFLFYLFFEFMLLPMYFLIGIWGGTRREYASIKFFIYTLVGSLFILIVMIGLYLSVIDPQQTAIQLELIDTPAQFDQNTQLQVQQMLADGKIAHEKLVKSFSMIDMSNKGNFIPQSFLVSKANFIWNLSPKALMFLLLFIGFAIKLPVVPVHTWLPDAHVEAPTPISVVLAGILLKIGGYGLMRLGIGIFSQEAVAFAWLLGFLGVVSIIYGALNALAMQDLKKMIAYSSVSHMGFVLLGLASFTQEGFNGAIYQMFSHGILSALLFLIVGVLYDRTHDRIINNYKGLLSKMPLYSAFTVVAFFASLGLPAFSGFIGELFTILGGFGSSILPKWMAVVATFGIVLGAAYFLWTLQRMYFGKLWLREKAWESELTDLNTRELGMLLILSIITFVTGILPFLIFDTSTQSVITLLKLAGF